MADFTIEITGTASLLMHNSRLSDPLDDATRRLASVTKKRTKSAEDHAEVSRLEHEGSLYIDANDGPYLPGANIEAALFRSAARYKLMTALRAALLIPELVNPLAYSGPRDIAGLWADKAFVHRASAKVGQARVIRTRPVFRNWAVTASGQLDTNSIDPGAFDQIVETAGKDIGLGDWRPRFGRFQAVVTLG